MLGASTNFQALRELPFSYKPGYMRAHLGGILWKRTAVISSELNPWAA
ncbi:hypothetical protein ATI61_108479 [Archangium gephyra]|uniref:Uncharacterized protein n=1 Tax=Archangium gephyra TaxID=48 RepID=A0ABX9JXJ4_9BACT|nr:hypothetical protein ATI61_108479 [Archangium gephyra]